MDIARQWVLRHYPQGVLAVLGGSAQKKTQQPLIGSDLDIVVVDPYIPSARWYTVFEEETVLEVWALPLSEYDTLFAKGVQSSNPTLQRLIIEGTVLVSVEPYAQRIIASAQEDWYSGPFVWTQEQREYARYALTVACDDVRALDDPVICGALIATCTGDILAFLLRIQGCWVAEGKHRWRDFARSFPQQYASLERVCRDAFADPLAHRRVWLEWIEAALAPYGGWLRSGFLLEWTNTGDVFS